MTDKRHDFEGFARAILENWPVNDIDGAELFDLSVSFGMIAEIPGGYDPEHHFDSEGICPERGDPWYEYTFAGTSGPGLYSVHHLRNTLQTVQTERDALQAEIDRLRGLIMQIKRDADEWAMSRAIGNDALEQEKGDALWQSIRRASGSVAPIQSSGDVT